MTKLPPPSTTRYQEKREGVLNAAAVLFNQRGVKGATLSDIASQRGPGHQQRHLLLPQEGRPRHGLLPAHDRRLQRAGSGGRARGRRRSTHRGVLCIAGAPAGRHRTRQPRADRHLQRHPRIAQPARRAGVHGLHRHVPPRAQPAQGARHRAPGTRRPQCAWPHRAVGGAQPAPVDRPLRSRRVSAGGAAAGRHRGCTACPPTARAGSAPTASAIGAWARTTAAPARPFCAPPRRWSTSRATAAPRSTRSRRAST